MSTQRTDIEVIQQYAEIMMPQIRELINANMTSVRGQMEADHYLAMREFDTIKCKQDKTNGRVTDLERTQRGYDAVGGEIIKNQAVIRWAKDHPGKAIAFGTLAAFGFVYIANLLSIQQILSWIK